MLVQKLLGRNSSRLHVCFTSSWRPPGGRSLPVCELELPRQLPRLLRWRRAAWSRAGQTFQGGEGCASRKWGLGSGISYFSWAPPTPPHDLPGEWAPASRAGWSCSLALWVGLLSRRHGHRTARGSGLGSWARGHHRPRPPHDVQLTDSRPSGAVRGPPGAQARSRQFCFFRISFVSAFFICFFTLFGGSRAGRMAPLTWLRVIPLLRCLSHMWGHGGSSGIQEPQLQRGVCP